MSLRSFVASLKKISLKSVIPLYHDFIHVYSPGVGTDSPRRQSFDVNRNVVSVHSFVASLKKCLLCPILYIFFHDLIHVYRPAAGADSPQGTKF